MSSLPRTSIIIPTYNRHVHLNRALQSVLPQATQFNAEVIVVDNNSTDRTCEVVSHLAAQHSHIRYIFEPRQGNSYARNTGIEHSRAKIVAFLDDDVRVSENWLELLTATLEKRPELSFVGGKVLPVWEENPPDWLTPEHWAPLAILDYGPEEIPITAEAPLGLLTANIAYRRSLFADVGLFLPSLQRVKNEIGSMEDHELLVRALRLGKKGIYSPEMVAFAEVEPERLTKGYHRRWHTGHGKFYAIMHDPHWEKSKFQLFGLPSHLCKQAAGHAVVWCSRVLRDENKAFIHECHLRFFHGFFVMRQRERFKSRKLDRASNSNSPTDSKHNIS